MSDADDYTRCVNCDCSLCLITGCWFDYCLECGNPICFSCQEEHKIRVKFKKTRINGKMVHQRDYTLPEDILPPYGYHHEDADDFDHEGSDEVGILGGCPWCKHIDDKEMLTYLITQSGKTREQIAKEIQDAKS